MRKGVCPNCQKPVDYDEGQTVQTCPSCQKDYLTSQASKLYGLLYSQHASNGNIALNTSMNFDKALGEYEKLLALDEESIDAVFGIALAKISLAKLGEDIIPELIAFLDEKITKIIAKGDYLPEIARYLLTLGFRYDRYFERASEVLKINNQYLDEAAKARFQVVLKQAITLWEFIIANLEKTESSDDLSSAQERLTSLREADSGIDAYQVISKGAVKYEEIKENAVFENRVALFKVRIVFMIAQMVFVVGAIIGFSIMMSNYATNPIPGLIVFGVFDVLFLISNIGGRIVKNKLSK